MSFSNGPVTCKPQGAFLRTDKELGFAGSDDTPLLSPGANHSASRYENIGLDAGKYEGTPPSSSRASGQYPWALHCRIQQPYPLNGSHVAKMPHPKVHGTLGISGQVLLRNASRCGLLTRWTWSQPTPDRAQRRSKIMIETVSPLSDRDQHYWVSSGCATLPTATSRGHIQRT